MYKVYREFSNGSNCCVGTYYSRKKANQAMANINVRSNATSFVKKVKSNPVNAKSILKTIFWGLSIVFALWVCASWADVVADNSMPNPEHSEANFFVAVTNE